MKCHYLLALGTLLGTLGFGVAGLAAEPAGEHVPFHSWTALRGKDVVLQRLDFSCGAASIATLATYFLGEPTTEEAALQIIRARYTPDEWKKKKKDGLSMEDLAYIAKKLGFEAEGARLGLAALLKLNGPVIVHFNKGEFQHFSVLRGIDRNDGLSGRPGIGSRGHVDGDVCGSIYRGSPGRLGSNEGGFIRLCSQAQGKGSYL